MSGQDEAPVTPELREALWEDAGLIRNAAGLARLASSPHLLASLVARSALAREESRGGHFRDRLSRPRTPRSTGCTPSCARAANRSSSRGADRLRRSRLPRRGRRRRRPDERVGRAGGRAARGVAAAEGARASSAASTSSRPSSASSIRTSSSSALARDGDLASGEVARVDGQRARAPHRRAHGAQPARPALRHRDAHAPLRRRRRGNRRDDPRHAQDDARPARAREARRSRAAAGRTTASASTTPILIKDNHLRLGGGIAESVRSAQGDGPSGRGRVRDARRRPRGARAPAPTSLLLDNMTPPAAARSGAARRRPREDRGIRRRHARHRPRRSPRRASTSSRSAR